MSLEELLRSAFHPASSLCSNGFEYANIIFFPGGSKRNQGYYSTQEQSGNNPNNLSNSPQVQAPEKVTLIVDGARFVVNPQIFIAHPDTMLGR